MSFDTETGRCARRRRRGAARRRALIAALVAAVAAVAASVSVSGAALSPAAALRARQAALAGAAARLVYLNHGVIDPAAGAPGAPAAYRLSDALTTTWLAQLRAPLDRARQVRFAALRPAELGYLPVDTYVVRATAAQAAALRADNADVRAVIPLQPYDKVRDAVLRAPVGTPLRILTWRDSPAAAVARRLAGAGVAVRAVSGGVIETRSDPVTLPRIAADPGVQAILPVGRMVALNTDARWVTETVQRDNFFLSDPVGSVNSLGLPGQGLDGSGEAVGVADTGSSYYPDRNGTANFYLSDCSDPVHPSTATCKLADRTYEAPSAGEPNAGVTHNNHALGLPGSGVHRKVEAYFDLVGDGDPNSGGPGGKWHGDSGASTHGTHTTGTVLSDRCDPCTPGAPAYPGLPYLKSGSPSYDGIAPMSRLVFQDVGDDTEAISGLPADLYQLWDQSYDVGGDPAGDVTDGAAGSSDDDTAAGDKDHAASVYRRGITPRILSFSIGSFIPIVSLGNSPRTDDFDVTHEDYLQVVAAGNSGPDAATVGEPGTAKDVLTVGATANGRLDFASLDTMAQFSSHGAPSILSLTPSPMNEPFVLSAIKPDVSTPGLHNISPKGGATTEATVLQGTSMATPTAAGDATLVRQYLEDGFGPVTPGSGYAVGTRSPARGITPGAAHEGVGGPDPTAALVKAIVIASAQRMRGLYTGGDGTNQTQDGQWPSAGQGWGRVDLSSALHFGDVPGSPDLWIQDVPYGSANPANPGGVATGEDKTYKLTVASSSRPLEVILDWTDPGGLASTVGAGPEAIVNQLQLQVDAPGGTTAYCGNNITTMQPGHAGDAVPTSVAGACPAADLDLANNVQGVYLPKPAPGVYTIHVKGASVVQPQNVIGSTPPCAPVINTGCKQGYALAATGSFSDPTIVHGGAPQVLHTPSITDVSVSTPDATTAVVHWRTASPSDSSITAAGAGVPTQTVADVYSRPSFPGLSLVQIETQGPNFLNVPVFATEHEAKLTGLARGVTYTLSISASNSAGEANEPDAASFSTPPDVFAIQKGGDTADFFEYTNSDVNAPVPISDPRNTDPWGTSSQFYSGAAPTTAGELQPGAPSQSVPVVGAFRFTLPGGVDLSTVSGAAVLLTTRQDVASRVLDLPHRHLDLLSQSVDSTWGPGTPHSTIDSAPAAAHVSPASSSMRDVPFQTEPLTFSCADLAALLDNLRSNGQAAFRLTANTLLDDSLYAYESGFGRRASGLEMGPKLVLYRGAGDPLDQAAGGTPVIANVRAERTGADDAVVYWDTSIPSNSLVLFRTTGTSDALIQVGSPAYTVHHEVGLTNLGGKPLEFAVRSATASGAAATDTGGAGHAFQLPLDLVAKPPLPPLAATAASHGGYDEATETQPSSVNQSHGDGLVCRAPVRGSTPGTPGAGGRGGGGGTKTKPGGGRQRAPKLSSLRVRPRVFRPLRSGGPISRARRGGTIVSYRDSAPATTTFVVLRRLPGVVRDRACVDPRLVRGSHAKLRRCARLIAAGSFSRRDRAGVNSFRFSGRLGRVALAAGTYILRATAALSGLQSAAVSTPFVVLRSRRNAAPRRSRCRDPDRDRDCDAVGQV